MIENGKEEYTQYTQNHIYGSFESMSTPLQTSDRIISLQCRSGTYCQTRDADFPCHSVKVLIATSDILITKTETKTRMIYFSFAETKTNTEKILKTTTIST